MTAKFQVLFTLGWNFQFCS